MSNTWHRRTFIRNGAMAGVGASLVLRAKAAAPDRSDKVRIGLIGVGARGGGHLDLCLRRKDVEVTAICDPDTAMAIPGARKKIQQLQPGHKVAEYTNGPEDYLNLLKRTDVDAVIIATSWEWHTVQALAAMKAGKTPAVEVCGAMDLEDCWQLVNTSESTGVQVFGMENVCYRRDVMAVLNMVRQGLFGELLHLQGGYQHDLRNVKFNDGIHIYGGGVEFGEKGISEAKWRTLHSVHRNGDLYPTHGLGPVANMININRGNRLLTLASMATQSRGLHKYILEHPKGGSSHPNAGVEFKLGDVVTTLIKCYNGETILLSHDTNSPRPYSLNFRVQGTNGLWMDDLKSLYIQGKSPEDAWEPTGDYKDATGYFGHYDHPLWKRYASDAQGAGHGGMDFFVLNAFIECIKKGKPYPLDVYDLATWYAITPLSERSVAEGGALQSIPDFTKGKWIHRQPVFALNDEY